MFESFKIRSVRGSRPCLAKLAVIVLVLLISGISASAADLAILDNGFSIRHERRQVVGSVTRLYLSKTDEAGYVDVPTADIVRFEPDLSLTNSATPAQTATTLPDMVDHASARYRLDPDLVNSVIHAESDFNPRAVSPKGAQGLMQLMPQTAAHLGVANAMDPGANVDGGTRYLRALLEYYNFNLVKALAAYNAGPQRVDQYRGVPPYAETQSYVAKIVRDFNHKKLAQERAVASHRSHTVKQTNSNLPPHSEDLRANLR
jgi:hypothetical protein